MLIAPNLREGIRDKRVRLTEVVSGNQVLDAETRQWEANGSRTEYTHHYVAHDDGVEVGFLSADICPELEYFVIYTVFVPPRLRRRGIGSQILRAAEALGKKLGYRKVLLNPHSLADEFLQKELESWYRRSGYLPLSDSHGIFTKDISQ
jgi:GNAT superfamily N-acetyltransferase